jgi:hypothetical protein
VERQEMQLGARIKLLEIEEARLLGKIELTRRQAKKMRGVKDDEEGFHRLRNSIQKEMDDQM